MAFTPTVSAVLLMRATFRMHHCDGWIGTFVYSSNALLADGGFFDSVVGLPRSE